MVFTEATCGRKRGGKIPEDGSDSGQVVCLLPAHILRFEKLFCHVSCHIVDLCHLDFCCCLCLFVLLSFATLVGLFCVCVCVCGGWDWRDLKKMTPPYCCLPLLSAFSEVHKGYGIKMDRLICKSGFSFPLENGKNQTLACHCPACHRT